MSVLLLTGPPGIGKTTVVKKVAAALAELHLAGFYTEEIRRNGGRQGFELVTFEERRWIMAHVDSRSGQRLGRYGVDPEAIDAAVRLTLAGNLEADLFLVDEIGKMECFSALFVQKVSSLLTLEKPVVATVALKGGGFIAAVKELPGVALWEITRQNRNSMPGKIISWVKDQGLRKR